MSIDEAISTLKTEVVNAMIRIHESSDWGFDLMISTKAIADEANVPFEFTKVILRNLVDDGKVVYGNRMDESTFLLSGSGYRLKQ